MGAAPASGEGFVYEPLRTKGGLIDVEASLEELAVMVDANWRTVWWMRVMPRRRRQLVRVELDWTREAWTAMNAAGGPSQD